MRSGTVTLDNCTLAGNSAIGGAGGVGWGPGGGGSGEGGAIFNAAGLVTITSSTIAGSLVTAGAGGAAPDGSSIGANGQTQGGAVFNFFDGTTHFSNSILALSTGAGDCDNLFGSISSDGSNLVEAAGTCTLAGTDVVGQDPQLGDLAANGGPTMTRALALSSPAVAVGSCSDADDQRGVPRLNLPVCDIGAFERNRFDLTVALAGSGTGSVASDLAGISCGAACAHGYEPETVVTLTATPDPTFTFAGWSGGGCAGLDSCVVTLEVDTQITGDLRRAERDPHGHQDRRRLGHRDQRFGDRVRRELRRRRAARHDGDLDRRG